MRVYARRMSRGRRRLSLVVLVSSGALMCAMTGSRFLLDASLWGDEALVAYNLISMHPAELFGPLDTGHQFPRLYLSLINAMRLVFGYQTMTLRALPFVAFVAGVAIWLRILWLRFGARPGLVALGCALCLVPGDWFAYGAMLKQYSLEVALALLPFLLRDVTLDRRWRAGEEPWRLWPWMLPCLFSLTYGISLLGRFVGYALGRARASSALPSAQASGVLGAGFSVALGASVWIDLRHAMGNEGAFGFWRARGCTPSGDLVADAGLLGHWLVDWFIGQNTFGGPVPVAAPVVAVLVAMMGVGAAVLLARVWRGTTRGASSPSARARDEWGTRGLSALVTVCGLGAAVLLFGGPMCANRLTLFAFFSLVLVLLEGADFVVSRAEHALGGGVPWVEASTLVITLAIVPGAASTVRALVLEQPPENVRPLLPLLASAPARAIVVGRCSGWPLLTLPEWIGRDDVIFVDERVRAEQSPLPDDLTEFWLITAGGYMRCPPWTDALSRRALEFRPATDRSFTASLHFVRLPEPDAPAP